MFRRVVSLGLSFLMLFEFGTGSAFALGDGEFNTAKYKKTEGPKSKFTKGDVDSNTAKDKDTEEPKYVDYCRGAPKISLTKQ